MYRPDQPEQRPRAPFGPPPPHGLNVRPPAACLPPHPGHGGPFSENRFLYSRPPAGHFVSPHCSNFPIDHSIVGGNQQLVPSAELQHHQTPLWNPLIVKRHPQDNSDRAGEEFLRCLAANKPLPDYLKWNMTYNLFDALKSAKDLKEAVKGEPQFQKHVGRNKSRSRSGSRGRSRGRSRAKSRPRSKSRGRSRSKGRSKSCARGKSRARSKSRACSRSRSQSRKSHKRSKSKVRRSKSRSASIEKKRKRSPVHSSDSSVGSSSNNLTGNSLLEGLKMVMKSKDLEERLPALKDAILGIQVSDETKKLESTSAKYNIEKRYSLDNMTSMKSDSMLLPHERVGSDFSWLNDNGQEKLSVHKASELEDEESFLYGAEPPQNGGRVKVEKNNFSVGGHQNTSLLSGLNYLVDPKPPQQISLSTISSVSLDSIECEKIKNILNSMGGTSDIGRMLLKTQGQKEGSEGSGAPLSSDTAAETLSNPNVRKALESLQSLIKAAYLTPKPLGLSSSYLSSSAEKTTKEKRTKSSDQSLTSSDKHRSDDHGDKKRTKMKQIESLTAEMEELLKHEGLGFISPVVGFYCQKCQEFIGDLNSAEKHATFHQSRLDKHARDSKGHSSSTSSQPSHSASWSDRDLQRNWKDEKEHRSSQRDSRSEQANKFLKEEMKKERMLITVSRGLTPTPQSVAGKQENKEHEKGKEKPDSSNKSSKTSREAENSESSDSSEEEKSPKVKHSKKKKKKEKKKKKSKH